MRIRPQISARFFPRRYYRNNLQSWKKIDGAFKSFRDTITPPLF